MNVHNTKFMATKINKGVLENNISQSKIENTWCHTGTNENWARNIKITMEKQVDNM